jgi:hypothetical protein
MATATYKIDKIPNPNSQDISHPQDFEYWPVCYDPSRPPPADGSYDANAFGMGATGGLRMSAFVDEFGSNGLKFSICQSDFSDSMQKIGSAMARKLQNLCFNYKLVDVDPNTPGLQPDCQVTYRIPTPSANDPTKIVMKETDNLPECADGSTNGAVTVDCWQLTTDNNAKNLCPISGQLISVLRTADELANSPLSPGTQIKMQCRTCPDSLSGGSSSGCDY